MKTREERELAYFRANRKGSGKARVKANRVPLRRLTDRETGETRSVRGTGIVVEVKTYTRDQRKAFLHFCDTHEITLVPVETVTTTPPGLSQPVTQVIAWQAYGEAHALYRLGQHKLVGNYYLCTTAKAPGAMCQLARLPRKKGKADALPSEAQQFQDDNELIRAALEWAKAQCAECGADGDTVREVFEFCQVYALAERDVPDDTDALAEWVSENVEFD